jgi:hypothetical protein
MDANMQVERGFARLPDHITRSSTSFKSDYYWIGDLWIFPSAAGCQLISDEPKPPPAGPSFS